MIDHAIVRYMEKLPFKKVYLVGGAFVLLVIVSVGLYLLFGGGNSNDPEVVDKPQNEVSFSPESTRTVATVIYTVQDGDTIESISKKYSKPGNPISPETIKWANELSDGNVLEVGERIMIPPVSGVVHTVVAGDTIRSVAEKYHLITPETTEEDAKKVMKNIENLNLLDEKEGTPVLAEGAIIVIPGGRK